MPVASISSSRKLPVSDLVESLNPWREKNPATDDLEESLKHAPMMAPLVVRKHPRKPGRWEVIAGHRRLKAARARGFSHVEVRIVAADDAAAEMLSLEENLRRRAVRDEPRALARLLDIYKAQNPPKRGRPKKGQVAALTGIPKLAAVTGKSPRDIRRLVKIGTAPEELQELYASGKVNVLQAEKLASLPPPQLARQLKLLTLPKSPEHTKTLEALRYALKSLKAKRAQGRIRREAILLCQQLQAALK